MFKSVRKIPAYKVYLNSFVRIAFFSALGAGLAYLIGSFVPLVDPVIAAITALIAIRPTFHDSMRESWGNIIGTFVGALISIVIVSFAGFNFFTLSLMILLSFLIAWVLRIGEEGAIAVGVTVVIVAGPLFGDIVSIEGRLFGVIVGALCALAVSYFVTPGKPHRRAVAASLEEVRHSYVLLEKVAYRLNEGISGDNDASEWMNEVNAINDRMILIKNNAEEAVKGSKWSPLLRRKETVEALNEVLANQDIVLNVRSICEDAAYLVRSGNNFNSDVYKKIAKMIKMTVGHIKQHVEGGADSREFDNVDTSEFTAFKNINDTQVIILGGSIARDSAKIKRALKSNK